MQRNKKILTFFFLPTSNHYYSVNNCNKFFPRFFFFFTLNECRIHNHNKHKKNYYYCYKVCAMIYILPSWEKNCRFEWHYFPSDFSKNGKENLSKKMISHFIKNRNWVALTPPNNMASSTSTKKKLPWEIIHPSPNNNKTFESWPLSPLPWSNFITHLLMCTINLFFWPVHLTFFSIGWFLYTTTY